MSPSHSDFDAWLVLVFIVSGLLCAWIGYMVGDHRATKRLLPYIEAKVDTTFVLPEPMHVGSTLGLHCYIERRDP